MSTRKHFMKITLSPYFSSVCLTSPESANTTFEVKLHSAGMKLLKISWLEVSHGMHLVDIIQNDNNKMVLHGE
jgi:hypothetical protein